MEVRQANDFEKRNYSPVRTRKCALLCYADLQKLNASLFQHSSLSVMRPIFSEDVVDIKTFIYDRLLHTHTHSLYGSETGQ